MELNAQLVRFILCNMTILYSLIMQSPVAMAYEGVWSDPEKTEQQATGSDEAHQALEFDSQDFDNLQVESFDSGSFFEEEQASFLDNIFLSMEGKAGFVISDSDDAISMLRSGIRLETWQTLTETVKFRFDHKLRLFAQSDDYIEPQRRHEFDTREIFLDVSQGNLNIRLGSQIVVWGDTEILPVTDVVSPRDRRALFFPSLEDVRDDQPMVQVNYYWDDVQLQALWVVDPGLNRDLFKGTRFSQEPAISDEEQPLTESIDGSEWGLRLQHYFRNGGLVVSLGEFLPNSPHSIPHRQYARYKLLGVSGQFSLSGWLLTVEAASKSDFNFACDNELCSGDRLDASIQGEYRQSGSWSFTMGISTQQWLSTKEDSAEEPGARENGNDLVQDSTVWLVGVSNSWFNDDLSVNFDLFNSVQSDYVLARLGARYQINDESQLGVKFVSFITDNPNFDLFEESPQALLEYKYFF